MIAPDRREPYVPARPDSLLPPQTVGSNLRDNTPVIAARDDSPRTVTPGVSQPRVPVPSSPDAGPSFQSVTHAPVVPCGTVPWSGSTPRPASALRAAGPKACRLPGCDEPARPSTGWCSEWHEERWFELARDTEHER